MHDLDVELEVLQKQMEAALRLSDDKSLAKNVRRKHRQTYHDTHKKVSLGLKFVVVEVLMMLELDLALKQVNLQATEVTLHFHI